MNAQHRAIKAHKRAQRLVKGIDDIKASVKSSQKLSGLDMMLVTQREDRLNQLARKHPALQYLTVL